MSDTLKIVTVSSLFPHRGEPSLGIFVERRLRYLLQSGGVEAQVVAPVPFFPFKGERFGAWGRMAAADPFEDKAGLAIRHPRYIVVPKIGMRFTPDTMLMACRKALRKILAEGFEPDLIDAHYLYPDGVAAAMLAQEFGLPFTMTARGSDVTEIPHYAFACKRIMQAVEAASHIMTVSQSLNDELVALGADSAKISTVRNGVDPGLFKPDGRQAMRAKLGLTRPTLLAAGWLIPRKRVDRVISLLALIDGWDLVVAGSGPLEAELKTLAASLGLESRVKFTGRIEPKQMPDVMAACDILVLASEREGWANVLLEAMACGTPVIASDAGGAREFVRLPGGVVASEPEAAGLKAAFDQLQHKMPEREQVRAYALGYGWDDVSALQKSIFRQCIQDYKRLG